MDLKLYKCKSVHLTFIVTYHTLLFNMRQCSVYSGAITIFGGFGRIPHVAS